MIHYICLEHIQLQRELINLLGVNRLGLGVLFYRL